jgi:hypothetical protein
MEEHKKPRMGTTNPEFTAKRVYRVKLRAKVSNAELGRMFGVRELTVWRWLHAESAPRLIHQVRLIQLERTYGLRD